MKPEWMPPIPDYIPDGIVSHDSIREYARAVAEACAAIVDEHRGPIEIYNKQYPALLECAKAIREAAKEIGK